MKNYWNDEIYNILAVGRSMEESHVNNFAFTKIGALTALDKFEQLGIPVLGGDVVTCEDGKYFSYNYDSWHCDLLSGETREDYTRRSVMVARKYINDYALTDAYFKIVPESQ